MSYDYKCIGSYKGGDMCRHCNNKNQCIEETLQKRMGVDSKTDTNIYQR